LMILQWLFVAHCTISELNAVLILNLVSDNVYCVSTCETMQAYDSYKEPINKIRNRIESGKADVYNEQTYIMNVYNEMI
jgi:hypothetical protein